MGEMMWAETYEFLKHALVKRSFWLSTPEVFLCVLDEPLAKMPDSLEDYLVVGL